MKKLFCVLLILCLLPACALGVDTDSFNDFASVFGAPELKDGTYDGKYTTFLSEGCSVYFREMEDDLIIYVAGSGENFIAYCIASIMYMEPDSAAFSYNCGQFLSIFLLTRTGEEHTSFTQAGNLLLVQKRDDGYVFAVNRK